MTTGWDKLLRLADELAREKGLELVVRTMRYQDGSESYTLSFQHKDSFDEVVKVRTKWPMKPADVWAEVQEALTEVAA